MQSDLRLFSRFGIKEEIRALWAAVQHVHSELNVWGGLDERQPVRTEPDQSPAQQEPHYTTFGFVLSTHASAGIWNGVCAAALKLRPNLKQVGFCIHRPVVTSRSISVN